MTYSEIIGLLANNLANYFDIVYHSAEIVNLKKEKFPAVMLADEWISLAPTDQKEILYIRKNGDDEVAEDLKLASCGKFYKMKTPLRIVFFKDHAKNHQKIISSLMQSVLISGTKLKSISSDKWKLQKEESSGNYNFSASTAYFAIDIFAYWNLMPERCEEDFCIDIDNPLKKELCPAVV